MIDLLGQQSHQNLEVRFAQFRPQFICQRFNRFVRPNRDSGATNGATICVSRRKLLLWQRLKTRIVRIANPTSPVRIRAAPFNKTPRNSLFSRGFFVSRRIGGWRNANSRVGLAQQVCYHPAMHIGEPVVTTLEAIGKSLVIEAKLME